MDIDGGPVGQLVEEGGDRFRFAAVLGNFGREQGQQFLFRCRAQDQGIAHIGIATYA